jgi:hypothetical protein
MPANGRTLDLVANGSPRAEPPRTPSIDDRRIITHKLTECYADGGYISPWTDQQVADDLGVPRAWVSEVREFSFGPEGSNPLFDQFLAACAEIQERQGEITEGRKIVLDMARKVAEEAARLRARCDDFDSKVRDVLAFAKRIEREVGR